MKKVTLLFSFLFLLSIWELIDGQSFIHPGLLHNKEDIDRMIKGISEKLAPFDTAFNLFRRNPQSLSTYVMQGPMASVGRNPTVGQGTYDSDANAAYQCAIMWCLTGDISYAKKSMEIVNAWSAVLKSITGRDAVLMAGLGPFKMVNAAEILRYTNTGWSDAEIRKTELHFKEVVYPVIKDFAPFANGNWDAAAIKTMIAIGIFCNNRAIFERGLRYYVDGWGDGRLTHYVINEEGQIQESGRDQGHTQLGIGLLAECCEMAWHQGLDLYAYADYRLLKGFEYTAKYNLGNDVPFSPTADRTGKYSHKVISASGRGQLRPVYEQIYNHYVNRAGIAAPYTRQAAERIRPEDQGRPGADHPGYGTLFYTRPARTEKDRVITAVPAPPGAITTRGSAEIVLTWIASVNSTSYTLKRASKSGGPYTVIGKNILHTAFTDKSVKPGNLYYYTVSASNAAGESSNAFETAICAGLPQPWQHQDIGKIEVPGSTDYDGTVFTIEGAGTDIGGKKDQCQFVFRLMNDNGTIVARFIPQVSSQNSKMGLMMREALIENSRHVSLLIGTEPSGNVEAPGWVVQFIIRDSTGGEIKVQKTGSNLSDPVVTNGRLTGYYWLKLERSDNNFTGFVSVDGITWAKLGSITVPLKKDLYIGIPVTSRLTTVSTTVRVDNITVSK